MINFQDDQNERDAVPEPEQNLFQLEYESAETLNRLEPLLDGDREFLMDGDGRNLHTTNGAWLII